MAEELEISRLEEAIARLQGITDRFVRDLARRRDAIFAPEGEVIQGSHRRLPDKNLLRRPHPDLPDPRLVEKVMRMRRLRERYFEAGLFADPAWDILLELCAARAQHRQVSVSSLCISANVPATTALRWISMMTEQRLLVRHDDPLDKRRAYVSLTDDVARALARYFDEIGRGASHLI